MLLGRGAYFFCQSLDERVFLTQMVGLYVSYKCVSSPRQASSNQKWDVSLQLTPRNLVVPLCLDAGRPVSNAV